jgi:hypothetical protein
MIMRYSRDDYFAFATINPLTEEVRFVHPIMRPPSVMDSYVQEAGWATADETNPLFETDIFTLVFSGNFSPDGMYFIQDYPGIVFDVRDEPAEALDLKNLSAGDWQWSNTSDQLVRLEVSDDTVQVLTYDIASDTSNILTEITINRRETETILYPQSWSRNNGIFLALRPMLPTAGGIVGQPPEVMRIDDTTGAITETCLTLFQRIDTFEGQPYVHSHMPPQFHWSRDGRYLALYGTLAGEADRETGSVYIYDMLENQIYEVYEGFANIVGWAVSPENE